MYKYSKDNTANTIAFHYFETSGVDYKKYFYFAEKWLNDHGFEPNKMGGKGRTTITFSRGKKALEKENFERIKNKGLWIASLPCESQIVTESFDYKASCFISGLENDDLKSECTISWDDSFLKWDDKIFLQLVKGLNELLKPKYAYAYQRQFKYGPSIYSWGAITGLPFNQGEERKEITRWSVIGTKMTKLYQPHFIRDVYRLNFLSPQHLNGPVEDGTLRDWINASPERGTLEPVVGDLWCWEVDEANIPKVREDLKPHNILIAFMDY